MSKQAQLSGIKRLTPKPVQMVTVEGPLLGEYAHATPQLSDDDTHKIIAALLKP